MTFSLALTAAGLIFELAKLNTSNESLAALSDDSSISFFYDVVKATRQKLFKNQLPMEYQRDHFLDKGDVRNLVIQIEPGQCRYYLAMTKPPAGIEVTVSSSNSISYNPIGTEPHFTYGRICAGKADSDIQADVRIQMTSGEGHAPYVLEAYTADSKPN